MIPQAKHGMSGMQMSVCFKQNRATLHLHGGITPWISDGTPHQWITPAGEDTDWPQGVSVGNVPDMNVCEAKDDGCQTFYYTNQQSARLMFYHDHSWGITRLNVYAGEAAGYLISDDTEKKLISSGTIPGSADTVPLIVQDRTFVPDAAQLAQQDPTWNTTKWGGMGSFWYHHVYMPAQNPGDPGGHELLRTLDVRAVVLAAGNTTARADREPVLQHGPEGGSAVQPATGRPVQPRRPDHMAVRHRPVLRAQGDPRHAEHLGRHGAVQRHADRQRCRVPDRHPGAQVVPAAPAQRRQRPVLQLPVVRR